MNLFCKQPTLEEVVFGVLVGVVCLADDIKRRASCQHFEHQHTQRPPVDAEVWNDTMFSVQTFNSLAPRRYEWNFIYVILKLILIINDRSISFEIILRQGCQK